MHENLFLATVGDAGVLRWEATTGPSLGPPLVGDQEDTAVAIVSYMVGGRPVLAVADDTVVRRWDAERGEPIGGPIASQEDSIVAMAAYESGGRTVLATTDGAGDSCGACGC